MSWREKGKEEMKKQDEQEPGRPHWELLALHLIAEGKPAEIDLSSVLWNSGSEEGKDWVLFWFTGWLLKTDTTISFSPGSLYISKLLWRTEKPFSTGLVPILQQPLHGDFAILINTPITTIWIP